MERQKPAAADGGAGDDVMIWIFEAARDGRAR
jgi:hypothetical protein